jgi:flagellar hook-associated protein 1 FlgK
MNEARNLLGRFALTISTSMNSQHKLGLDMDGNVGGNLFTPININTSSNIRQPSSPANTGTAALGLAINDVTKFAASDYEVNFTGAATGNVIRRSDGVVTAFGTVPVTIDGLTISVTAGAANNGDRFLIKPFVNSANIINTEFATPRALAVASPVSGIMGTSNTGSLQQTALLARTNPPANVPVTLTFTGANSFTRSDIAGTFTYTSGQPIDSSLAGQWSVTLKGVPKAGDTFLVQAQPAAFRNLNSGNASAMMGLRDTAMFDGAALTDGYASLIAQIGIRAMSADYAANVSGTIATSAEKERSGMSGVNLDEEASKLLQYQQAYQASAKMIQIANSIFDTLLQTMMR